MPFLIAFVALFSYWLHAQLKLGRCPRLISSGAVLICLIAFHFYSGNAARFYEHGHLARTMETISRDFTGEKRSGYDAMIQRFRSDPKRSATDLVEEAARIDKKHSLKTTDH